VVRALARHRQDACATSFTSEMETLYFEDINNTIEKVTA
jgi:hypothetical protein